MGLVLVRYGEIALKGQNRVYFFRKLRRNIRICLRDHDIEARIWQDGQRIYVETDKVQSALDALARVFGLVSASPVLSVAPDLEEIKRAAVLMAERAGLDQGSTFRVRASRADKSFPFVSPVIEREVGASVVAALEPKVRLSGEVDLEIGVEVQQEHALLFGEVIRGPGGMPLGSQGRVIALLSSGIDSPVATWLMMKRGCSVVPVHFATNQQQADQLQVIVEALNRYGYGAALRPIVLAHDELLSPIVERLGRLRAQRWTCLFCKRAFLIKAAAIADQIGATAIVTGDSLGQVASQTLPNLEVVSYGIGKPILRPLIGMDKVEIMALARQIGTYSASIGYNHACPFVPDKPRTQASVAKLLELLGAMDEVDTSGQSFAGQASQRTLG